MKVHSLLSKRVSLPTIFAAGAMLLLACALPAVMPATLEQAAESDFTAGELKGAAVTSAGKIHIGRQLTVLMHSENAPAVVSAVAIRGKTLFAASGSDNAIYKVEGGKSAKFATVGGTLTGSLLVRDGDLLAGVCGSKGAGVYRIDDKGQAKLLWSDPDVKYVWAMAPAPGGKLYVATGPKALVFVVDLGAGKGQKLFEAKDLAKNILCLAVGADGTLYAGTDQNGLVISIDPVSKASRVRFDAPEKEVSAIAVAGDGSLYAATSDVSKAGGEGPGEGGEASEHHMPETAGTAPNQRSQESTSKPVAKPAAKPVSKPAPTPAAASAPATAAANDEDGDGEVVASGPGSRPSPAPPPGAHGPHGPGGPTPGGGENEGPGPGIEGPGNAVYHIGNDGLVRVVIRRPLSIFAMLLRTEELVLATGNSGQLLSVKLPDNEVTLLVDTEASQLTSLVADGEGNLYFGTANKGSLCQLGGQYAKSGTFVCKPIDAQQIAKWGTIRLRAAVPADAGLTVATRSGNLAEPKDNTWSAWSKETPYADAFLRIASPAGRFLQYRLTFTSDGKATAQASDVRLIYQVGNLAPEVTAVQVSASASEEGGGGPPGPGGSGGPREAGGAPMYFRNISIQASDPNSDQLTYTLEYREVGSENWIKVSDKLDKPQYSWDSRTVPDGTYEFRVTASDQPSNPPAAALTAVKVSTPVVVDNTPPTVKELVAKVDGKRVSVTGLASDAASRIASIHYSLDSATEWTTVLPDSGLCDSESEVFTLEIKDAKPGTHRVTVKAADAFGNTGYGTVTATVAK